MNAQSSPRNFLRPARLFPFPLPFSEFRHSADFPTRVLLMARSGRGRNAAPHPSTPSPPSDLSSSSASGARPTPAVEYDPVTTSGGSDIPEDSSRHNTTPPPVEQGTAFTSPLSPITAAALQSPSSTLPAAAVQAPPSPSQRMSGQFNYASSHNSWAHRFYQFLTSSLVYEALLHATTLMNKKHGKSDPYTVQVSYEQMWKLGAHVDLIRATCNSINNRHVWLLPASKRFLRDNGCVNESNETCLSFTGFPQSMQTLEEFRRGCSLVQHVNAFEGKNPILAPTVHGRLLIDMSMVAIAENHSQDISWGGKFSENDILIIKWSCKRRRVSHETYEMKILQDPVKDKERKLRTAMVRDMHRASEIFIPLYKIGDDLPVYFAELKEDLEGAKEAFVAKEWFREYLCFHVAIMPSTGRRDFEVLLHTMYTSCDMGYMPIMTAKPTVYPNDWRELVNSVENVGLPLSSDSWNRPHSCRRTGKTSADKQIDILHDVYSHNNNPTVERTDKYENSVRGLLRLKRNVLEHGGQGRSIRYIADLELCAAERFGEFLPWLVRSLLENGQMVRRFGVAWNDFMVSQADQSDPWSY